MIALLHLTPPSTEITKQFEIPQGKLKMEQEHSSRKISYGHTKRKQQKRKRTGSTSSAGTSTTSGASSKSQLSDASISNENIDASAMHGIVLQSKSNTSSIVQGQNQMVLRWGQAHNTPTFEAEEALLPLLLKYGKKERGMMKKQHYFRIKAIKGKCHELGIRLDQALSLRRTHMMLLNPNVQTVSQLALGKPEDIRTCSALFEESVGEYLIRHRIDFHTEEEQKAMVRKGERTPPTPDFLLKETILLDSKPVNWIEAKMFYGASTIPDGTKNAVGGLLRSAGKYVDRYGPGAFVFSFGYGSKLQQALEKKGAISLDARPLNLQKMKDHQRSWCADDRGQILP